MKKIKYITVVILFIVIIYYSNVFFIVRKKIMLDYYKWTYYDEYNDIRNDILSNKNCNIIKILGNKDITYENILAKIKVNGKGTFEIQNLSSDANRFPENVWITEVDSMELFYYSCKDKIARFPYFDIGTEGILGEKFNIEVNSIKDIINNYDKFKSIVGSIPVFPEFSYIKTINGKYEGFCCRLRPSDKIFDNANFETINGFSFAKRDSLAKALVEKYVKYNKCK